MKTNKWMVLGVYSLAAALSQLLWLNFAPLLTLIQNTYGVSESKASLLILVFPLIYVLLSIPAGMFIDRVGYRRGVGAGVLIMTAFSLLRINTDSFNILLAAQIGIAIAQPFIINGISKLVLDWFPKEQSAMATGLGTMGMFIGMAAGMAATPFLVGLWALQGTMIFFASVCVLSALAFLLFVKEKAPAATAMESSPGNVFGFFQNPPLVLLFVLSLLGLGFFNGLTTWLELILAPHGINSEQAGVAGGVLVVGGIFGAGIIPALSDYFKKRKPFLVGSIAIAALTVLPLCNGHHYSTILLFSALQGFFFLPAFSLLIEMCSELVGEAGAASATGLLMLMGNAGGVVVVMAMEWVKGDAKDFASGVNLLLGLLILSLVISVFIPETKRI